MFMATQQEKYYGGLEEEFVGGVADTHICHICAKPLRDPHITKCCGHNFCESCLEQWAKKHLEECCPFCRSTGEEFEHFLDKKTKREIDALKVRCSNHRQGCEWVGELGALNNHLNIKCDYVEVECPNRCYDGYEEFEEDVTIKHVMRKDLKHHLRVECNQRSYRCEYCGKKDTYKNITESHYYDCPEFPVPCPNSCGITKIKRKEVNQHHKTCPLEIVVCPFVPEGCEAWDLLRKDEAEHMEKNIVNHQLLMLKSLNKERRIRQEECNEMDMELDQWYKKAAAIAKNIDSLLVTCTEEQKLPLESIRSLIDDSYCLRNGTSLNLRITKFSEYKQSNGVWYSVPFYLGDVAGLKVRLAVYPNGIEAGAGTHVSLILQNLQRDLESPIETECGSFVQIGITNSSNPEQTYSCITKVFCECGDNTKTAEELHCEHRFVPHTVSEKLCDNSDALTMTVKLLLTSVCYCSCHSVCHRSLECSDSNLEGTV